MRPRRILLFSHPGFGDVLLATTLVRAIRRAWPDAAVDVMTHRGREAMLAGNPDVRRAIPVPKRPNPFQLLGILARTAGRYDISLAVSASDRAAFLLRCAGRRFYAVLRAGDRGKQRLVTAWAEADPGEHEIVKYQRLADLLGIERCTEVVPPRDPAARVPVEPPYAVLHATTHATRKRWTPQGWRALRERIEARGMPLLAGGLAAAPPPASADLIYEVDIGVVIPSPGLYAYFGVLDWAPDAAPTFTVFKSKVPTTDLAAWDAYPEAELVIGLYAPSGYSYIDNTSDSPSSTTPYAIGVAATGFYAHQFAKYEDTAPYGFSPSYVTLYNGPSAYWMPGDIGYVGLKVTGVAGKEYYGWLALKLLPGPGYGVEVLKMAFHTTPGVALPAGVPEPGSMALGLLAAGAAGVARLRRRRREDAAD